MTSSIVSKTSGVRNRGDRKKKTLTPQQLADLKSKSIFHLGQKKGHWSSDKEKYPKAYENTIPKQNSGLSSSRVLSDGTMNFNMAVLGSSSDSSSAFITQDTYCVAPDPLVDDAAPYSGIGIVELRALCDLLLQNWGGSLNAIPESVRHKPHWQYGTGSHASPRRKILGSVKLSAVTDQVTTVSICHLVVEGSSQWVIGRNVTRKCNINHIESNTLEFLVSDSRETNTMSLIDAGEHSFLPVTVFMQNEVYASASSLVSLSCSVYAAKLTWPQTKNVIDKVHRHVCGHSTYEYIKLLLIRNKMWDEHCAKHLSHLLESCSHCDVTKHPPRNRKVSLSSMSRNFNEVVCVDHFIPDNYDVMRITDSKKRYSTGLLVPTTTMKDAICTFECKWLSEFWPPPEVLGDQAFGNSEFTKFLSNYDIRFRFVPPRRHSKNVLESRHRILRDIYLLLKSECLTEYPRLLVAKMFKVSNDLYGNNIASVHELAKGYTRPVVFNQPKYMPQDIHEAQQELSAKRELNMILSSKSIQDTPFKIGDIVQIYVKLQNQKRGSWSEPTSALEYDPLSQTVTVAGAYGRHRKAAIEDTRHALSKNELAKEIQAAIDILSSDIEKELEKDEFNTELLERRFRFADHDDIIGDEPITMKFVPKRRK